MGIAGFYIVYRHQKAKKQTGRKQKEDGCVSLECCNRVQAQKRKAHMADTAARTIQACKHVEQAGDNRTPGQIADKSIKQAGCNESACFYTQCLESLTH